MEPVPIFTCDELAAAFRLVLPPDVAERCARQWFDQFASESMDQRGKFVYKEWWDQPGARCTSGGSKGTDPQVWGYNLIKALRLHGDSLLCCILVLAAAQCGDRGTGRAEPPAGTAGTVPEIAPPRAPVTSVTQSAEISDRMDDCADPKSVEVRISSHCIGPIAWDSTLGNIRRHFLPHEFKAYLEATPIVTWRFEFGRATILASQQYDQINPDDPANYWVVSGDGVVLPGGGHFPSTWGAFRKAYSQGMSVSSGELGVAAETCQMPGLSFMLSLPLRDPPIPLEPDSIPSGTPIVQVELDRGRPPSDSLVTC
jgi:hypothetical protein